MSLLRPSVALAAIVAMLAACGGSDGGKDAAATGSVALGKRLFTEKECISCHSLSAAASESEFGPNLDRLPQLAERAGKPLEAFIHESIVDPGAYTEAGFPADRMPRFFNELSDHEIASLVVFLLESVS